MNDRVCMSVHGVRTRGVWQKALVPVLVRSGFMPIAIDYGWMSALKLIDPRSLDRYTDLLVHEYDALREEYQVERPSVVAHSFGTLQVGHLLKKYRHVTFDKVILAASILPREYDWPGLLEERRVQWVENDFGSRDRWPRVAAAIVPGAGSSGSVGFSSSHPALHQVCYEAGHSDFFSQGHFRRAWVPTLTRNKRHIIDTLVWIREEFSRLNGIPVAELRCFVFEPAAGASYLAVVPGLTLGNLASGEERVTIDMNRTRPGPARAMESGTVNMLETRDSWELRRVPAQSVQISPRLVWSASIPLEAVGPGQNGSVGVVILDGLAPPPRGTVHGMKFPEALPDMLNSIGAGLYPGRG